ncbi:DUF2937 family protein [uncultured Roseobacter sp.]|uniref:DUF2937 family protein n=1 Tax=uncultured Roseobacter sp. TaxID=114847 RepID=UPI00260B8000|nr:DUF2937 family protein [uncultured Roseobacter sp.]
MILRAAIFAVSLSGALGAAQFPAFSQQYLQRLGGAVDALDQVVADFDASAAALGLTRDAALAQMTGSAFVEARRVDMQRTFERHAALSADLVVLSGHGPFMRAYHAARLTDAEVARGAWSAFRPSLPLTPATALFAMAGFLLSWAVLRLLFMLLPGWPRRRVQQSA